MVSKKTLDELTAERDSIRESIWADQTRLRELEYKIHVRHAESLGLPKKDGWYLDSNGSIAQLEDGVRHDGWGNYGSEDEYIVPPMTRLVPEKKTKKKEN